MSFLETIDSLYRNDPCWSDVMATSEWRTLTATLGELDGLTPANVYRVADVAQMLASIAPHIARLYSETLAWKQNLMGTVPTIVVEQLQGVLYTTIRHYQAAVVSAQSKGATTIVAPNLLDDMRQLVSDALHQFSTTYVEKCRTPAILQWLRGAMNSIISIGKAVGTFFRAAAMITMTVAEKAGAIVVAGVSNFSDLLKLGGMAVIGWLAYAFSREYFVTGRLGLPRELKTIASVAVTKRLPL